MKLTFLFLPVPDLAAALPFYRDELGWDEAWREGETTVAFALPGSDVMAMVGVDTGDPPGPIYEVASVSAFMAEHPDLPVASEHTPIPDGSMIGYRDPGGNVFYVLDQIDAELPPES